MFESLPDLYKGLPVINGDNDDLRFLDNDGKQCIVGLVPKGLVGKKDNSGFIIREEKINAPIGSTVLINKRIAA